MRFTIVLISTLFAQIAYADFCQVITKLHSTVGEKYKPLVGQFDIRGRYFQPSVKLVSAPAKCRIRSLPLPGGYYTYSCRWEFTSKVKLETEFKAVLAKLKTCRINNKAITLINSTNDSPRRNSDRVKWTNFSKHKAILGPNTVMSISKQTVIFTSKNLVFNLLQFSFGSGAK